MFAEILFLLPCRNLYCYVALRELCLHFVNLQKFARVLKKILGNYKFKYYLEKEKKGALFLFFNAKNFEKIIFKKLGTRSKKLIKTLFLKIVLS